MPINKKLLVACFSLLLPFLTIAARADAPPPVEAFSRLPNLQDAQLSPDGQRLAVLMPLNGKQALVVLPVEKDSGITPKVGVAGEWQIVGLFWKTNDLLFVDVLKTERVVGTQPVSNVRVLLFNVTTGAMTDFSNQFKIPITNVVSILPDDPDHILVALRGAVALLDIHSRTISFTRKGPERTYRWIVDDKAIPRAAVSANQWLSDVSFTNYVMHPDGSYDSLVTTNFSSGPQFEILGLAQNPDHLVVLSDHEGGRLAAYEYDPGTKRFLKTLASDQKYDVGGALRWAGRLVGVTEPKTVYFDPAAAALQGLVDKALPDTRNIIAGMTHDQHFALVRAYAADQPMALYRLTLGEKKKLALIGVDYPELDGRTLARVKKVQYAAHDGQAIEAILTIPAGQKGPIPFVVLPHGGPTAHDRDRFDYWAQFLASRGYGVLQPNFRGSTGYGTAFMRAGQAQWGSLMQSDVDDGTKWLIDQHLADPARICIVGGSYGGYVSLVAATSRPDLYRCAVAWAPVTDLGDLVRRIELFNWKDPNLPMLGTAGRSLDDVSPAQQASKAAMPILLFHGEQDFTVRVEQSREMEAALKAAGKPVDAVYYKDENHFLSLASTRQDFLTRTEAFLAHNIGPASSN